MTSDSKRVQLRIRCCVYLSRASIFDLYELGPFEDYRPVILCNVLRSDLSAVSSGLDLNLDFQCDG